MTTNTGAGTDGGTEGNNEGGDAGKGGDDAQLAVIKGLTDQVAEMKESFGNVTTTMEKLNEKIDANKAAQDDLGNGDPDDGGSDEKDDPLSDSDIEQMTRPEYTRYLMGQFKQEVNNAITSSVKPLEEKVETQANDVYTKELKAQVATLEDKNKDFWDWKNEISEFVKINPLMKIGDAYELAKIRNPDKLTKLNEKYKDDPAGDENKGGKGKKPGFGGMKPNGGGKTAPITNLTAEQAAEIAFDEVFSDGQAGEAT